MPIYDYRCRDCAHEFDVNQAIVADPLKDCPECKASSLYRKISRGGHIQFKGSGFYCTDYPKKAKPKPKAKK